MKKANLRRLAGIILLIVSLLVLLWGLWPVVSEIRVVPVSPQEMQLPESFLPGFMVVAV